MKHIKPYMLDHKCDLDESETNSVNSASEDANLEIGVQALQEELGKLKGEFDKISNRLKNRVEERETKSSGVVAN